MTAQMVSILMIGEPLPGTDVTLARLAAAGWASCRARTLRDGQDLMKTFRIDVVLAAESLPDGRGYDIAESVLRQSGTLLVGIALSENTLWLPVVERGQRVLGNRAIGAGLLETEMLRNLTTGAAERGAPSVGPLAPAQNRAGAPVGASPKRKNAGVA